MSNFRFGKMTVLKIFIVLVNIISYSYSASVPNKDDLFFANVTMKGYQTTQEDEYGFAAFELPDEELTIIGYLPLITMNAAHHMLTYVCAKPGNDKLFWSGGGACNGPQMIVHGWARNAPALTLPEDVGIKVGRNSQYKYIVANIHYLSIQKNDTSGNQVIMSRKPRKYRAGVMLAGSSQIFIKPKTHTFRSQFSCHYMGPTITIFAVRVHAHQWGRVNSLYRIRKGELSQVAKGDPQWPQSFYPLSSPVTIEKDDYLIGQCVYDNNGDRTITVGSTHNDEMCNVYSMYSYAPDIGDTAPFVNCYGNGFPEMANLLPPESVVPPLKPEDIGGTEDDHEIHAEHKMNLPSDIEKQYSNDDQSYEEYVDEVEHMRDRDRGTENTDINRILSHLGVPEYEYIDADNYDYLLPKHLTYGKEQTVKLHNAKTMNSSIYTNIETWPDAKSLPATLGQIGGIALTNANDELVVFYRGSRRWEEKYFEGYRFRNEVFGPIDENVLIHIDTRTGQTKYEWGTKMFYMPHGLTIDHEGNFWVTDIAMHQVLKFKPDDLTHPVLTVGELFKSGAGPKRFCRPADIAVMKNGDFFVADGYCNNRIVKFNGKGEFIMEWGSPMTGARDTDGYPLPNQWNIVHSVALNEEAQLVCGADRENFRIQCFNSKTGDFVRQIRVENKENIGPIYAIEFAPNVNGTILFAVTGGPVSKKKVYMIDVQTGDILTSFDSKPSLISPHDIAVSTNAREIYVAELASSPVNALHKFELVRKKELPTQTFVKQIYNKDKNFRISLMIMVAFAIPILVAMIIGCIIRIRNIRKLRHINAFLDDVKTGGVNNNSILGNWMNRRKGFEKLEQYSDGENEPLDSHIGDDSNNNSGDETFTIPKNQQANRFNNITTTATF